MLRGSFVFTAETEAQSGTELFRKMLLVHPCVRHVRTRRGAARTDPRAARTDPGSARTDPGSARTRPGSARTEGGCCAYAGDRMRSGVAILSARGGDGALARLVQTRPMTGRDTSGRQSDHIRSNVRTRAWVFRAG
jgi:hypothetical protein